MKSEDLLTRRLRDHGIRRVFGIPGGPSLPFMDAFRREGIEFILTSHEASAAVMADVTARLTGVTGVCHGTFGPGAVNLASGVGGALLDRSPVLALTSEVSDEWLGRTTQMHIDHQALFRPLTKATFRLNAANAEEVLCRSLDIANEEYPGPVHIGLPSDVAGKETGRAGSSPELSGESFGRGASEVSTGHSAPGASAGTDETGTDSGHDASGKKPGNSERGLRSDRETTGSLPEQTEERVRVLIASARRPLIAVGLTAARAGIGETLARFLEKHSVPVVVTPMAKGVISSGHPSYAGVLFHALSDRLKRLVNSADLVIGLGYDAVEYNYESWLPDVPLVHFDTRASDLRIRGAIESLSAPDKWFEALTTLQSSPEMTRLAAEVRSEIRNEIYSKIPGFNPVTALAVLQEMLPFNTVVTADVGSHLHLLGQMWEVPPGGRLLMTNGWSSMGFGLPAALAAALAEPERPVVCVTGDGGMLMHAGEMITARRLGLKIVVVVLSDGELNLIKIKESRRNIRSSALQLYSDKLFGAERFLGAGVLQVTDTGQMRSAVKKAMQSNGSTIIEATVDPSVYSELISGS
ncbi:MAG: thiamine pyrophosphate-binding protein [Bacteroidales bacterium]|nr:thiamine pyrophosphate-binding protein [Bacteroidales bacterium]MDT8374860.1 thiamine pyrophosphate-binding protein [Bacteroidales bacterium]